MVIKILNQFGGNCQHDINRATGATWSWSLYLEYTVGALHYGFLEMGANRTLTDQKTAHTCAGGRAKRLFKCPGALVCSLTPGSGGWEGVHVWLLSLGPLLGRLPGASGLILWPRAVGTVVKPAAPWGPVLHCPGLLQSWGVGKGPSTVIGTVIHSFSDTIIPACNINSGKHSPTT